MFKFFVFAACLAVATAGSVHPIALAALPVPAAYANAPLNAAGGSQQIDVRHNYDGTLSSYTTTPFGYTSPISSRYVAGAPTFSPAFAAHGAYTNPAVYSIPAAYASSAIPAAYATQAAYAAPAAYANPAAYAAPANYINYAAPYAAPLNAAFASAPAKIFV